jgi:hypothetical protein
MKWTMIIIRLYQNKTLQIIDLMETQIPILYLAYIAFVGNTEESADFFYMSHYKSGSKYLDFSMMNTTD